MYTHIYQRKDYVCPAAIASYRVVVALVNNKKELEKVYIKYYYYILNHGTCTILKINRKISRYKSRNESSYLRRICNSIKSSKSIYVRYDLHRCNCSRPSLSYAKPARITAPLAFICPLYLNVINATIYILRAISLERSAGASGKRSRMEKDSLRFSSVSRNTFRALLFIWNAKNC